MGYQLIPVTARNRDEMLGMRVAAGQEGLIETVGECLGEADENAAWQPVGIYCDGMPIGFAMYGQFPPNGRAWMDRLLIDARHQGKGHGRAALALLLESMTREYGVDEITLSIFDGNDRAQRLYESFGFRFTGEIDTKGERMMVRKRPQDEMEGCQ